MDFFEQGRCYSSPLQGEFNIFSGISSIYRENTSRFNTGFEVGFHGKVYPLPEYGQVSNIARFFNNTIMTELGLEAVVTDTGIDSVLFFAKTVWTAYHRQNITRDMVGDSVGYSVLAGLASAFDHTQYKTAEFEDWIGAVHVFGPSTELAIFYKNGYIRMNLNIFGDFAMVRSFAFQKYKRNHSIDNVKIVLKEQNYYYAYGISINPKIEIRYGPYRLEAAYQYSHYDSFEGAERVPTLNDFHLVDELEEYRLALSRRVELPGLRFLPTHHLWIEAEVRHIDRTGFIADDRVSHAGGNTWLFLRFKMPL